MADSFNPNNVDLDSSDPDLQRKIICYLTNGGNEYNGHLGARISSVFVVGILSTIVTFFPVVATRIPKLKIPLYVYLFARYFGSGVIIATAFIHLLDPAYDEIGAASCVGLTGGWAEYSWPPAIALTAGMFTFLLDFAAEYYVSKRYGLPHSDPSDAVVEDSITSGAGANCNDHQHLHSGEIDNLQPRYTDVEQQKQTQIQLSKDNQSRDGSSIDAYGMKELKHISGESKETELLFQTQIAAFLVLEFGVLFHSIFIGLNLGVAGDEFSTLYPVVIFHQSFEGLGIGARLSAIPFPKRLSWMPWVLCLGYGLTTPIAIAIGLGVRTTYDNSSFTANVVNGVFDSISAGILLYTGFVEMIARDFLFNPHRTNKKDQLAFMIICLFLGAAIMALLGKWA